MNRLLPLVPHGNAVCKLSGLIRKYLTSDSAKIIDNGLIVSKLDYCNSVLYVLIIPLILFKNYITFRTQLPVLSPSPQDSSILSCSQRSSLATSSPS